MYRGFNLKLDGLSFPDNKSFQDKVTKLGGELHSEHQLKIKNALDSFFTAGGKLDSSKMRANWFPLIKSDIFISHSHSDRETAVRLSGWMKESFGLTCFIDSCAWGYGDKLLWLIDKEFCWEPEEESFVYEKRNLSTSHVHMMLSTALSKMIDQSECIFFLNTPQSISPSDAIEGSKGVTLSPWIYSEIAMTGLIRRRTPDQHRVGLVKKATLTKSEKLLETLKVIYDVDLDHLTDLSVVDINAWQKNWRARLGGERHALDDLYKLKPGG